MNDRTRAQLIHGGHKGTESEFGSCAERWGIDEVTLSFEGHDIKRSRNVEMLPDDELEHGSVSMAFVCERLGREFHRGKGIRRVIQSMFPLVTRGKHLFAVGWIQEDGTVKGGTGWGVEVAKFFNREVSVYDQDQEAWRSWEGGAWVDDDPEIPAAAFSATGTRNLTEAGRAAIQDLFVRSFGPA